MDALEIIRQLEGDAGLRAQMRAVLLGDELLELPELVRRLTEAQLRTEERLREFQEATERRFEGLETDVSVLKTDVSVLKTDVSVLKTDVGDLKGRSLEDRLRAEPRRYLPSSVARRARAMPADAFDELLERLSPEDADELRRADALIEARLAGGDDVVFAAEAAWTAHTDDVERAARRAEILRAAGYDARAVVVSQRDPAPAVLDRAASLGVVVVTEASGLLVPPAA